MGAGLSRRDSCMACRKDALRWMLGLLVGLLGAGCAGPLPRPAPAPSSLATRPPASAPSEFAPGLRIAGGWAQAPGQPLNALVAVGGQAAPASSVPAAGQTPGGPPDLTVPAPENPA